ncbi:MAG: IS4 family transposase [Planctomycetota bacterium]
MLGDDFHAKRVLSLANGVTGTIHGATLGIHAIGQGLAQAQGLNPKHAVKQVDRLLSNAGISVEGFFEHWVPFVLGAREDVYVALDWTEFDADDHCTIALYLITSHGRATPLLWKTVTKSTIEGWRNDHEDGLLALFAKLRPTHTKRATVLADRGFGDQKLYPFLVSLGLDFIIRFRGLIHVEAPDGQTRTAAQWLAPTGRAVKIRDALVTSDRTPVAAVVCVHAPGMKEAWFLATSRADLTGAQTIKAYGKRFSIEETFRDCKDARFGMGLKATHIGDADRRDRLLILAAISQALLTLLGAAAEETGLDRMLKANTVKRRTHSLFTQGSYWYGAIPTMPDEWLAPLMAAFGRLVSEQRAFAQIFGVL